VDCHTSRRVVLSYNSRKWPCGSGEGKLTTAIYSMQVFMWPAYMPSAHIIWWQKNNDSCYWSIVSFVFLRSHWMNSSDRQNVKRTLYTKSIERQPMGFSNTSADPIKICWTFKLCSGKHVPYCELQFWWWESLKLIFPRTTVKDVDYVTHRSFITQSFYQRIN